MSEVFTTISTLKKWFPLLKNNSKAAKLTSPIDQFYNCVGWAVGDHTKWWEPLPSNFPLTFWPIERSGYAIDAYASMFESQGFSICPDESFEDGFNKIAVYVNEDNIFCHVARQTKDPSRGWSSKCGKESDIWHVSPQVLEGPDYGKVWGYMKKAI